ncbi:Glutamyl-tRNA(Gln) amidotransferase subunit A [Geodia barretti]|nr:Glutamyl-tRNA(Gln) amidotransferase subunit A [Geodia barretti]
MVTTGGSSILRDFVPDEDSTVMARLKDAGAVLLGKLNMSEFAMADIYNHPYGTPRNPWDTTRNPGTSSSGSGAATAAFLCATSLGEDTGGSIRSPANFSGLVGLRPTYGRGEPPWSNGRLVVDGHRRPHLAVRRGRCNHVPGHRGPRPEGPVHLGRSGARLPGSTDRRYQRAAGGYACGADGRAQPRP